MILESIMSIGGLVVPPLFDFIKKKFLGKDEDTFESTLSTLATTQPSVMATYVEATAKHLDAQTRYFNRDIAGTPSIWVVNLRGAIRPGVTILAILFLGCEMLWTNFLDSITRATFCTVVTSWFGSRITLPEK